MNEQPPVVRKRGFVQAPVAPLDNDGVQVARLGTLAWIIATGILWLNRDTLAAADKGWWLGVGAAGIALGVALLIWTMRRRRKGVQRARRTLDQSVESHESAQQGDGVHE